MSVGIIGTGKSATGGTFLAGGGTFTGLSIPAGGLKVTSGGGIEFNGVSVAAGVQTAVATSSVSAIKVNGKFSSGDELGYGSSVSSSYRPSFMADPQKGQWTALNETVSAAGVAGYYSGSTWYQWYHRVSGNGSSTTSYDGNSSYATKGTYNQNQGWTYYVKSNGTVYGTGSTDPNGWNWQSGPNTTVRDIASSNGSFAYTVQDSGYMQHFGTSGNQGTIFQSNGIVGGNQGISIEGNGSFYLASFANSILIKSTNNEPNDQSYWQSITNPLAALAGNVDHILWNPRSQRWVLRAGQYLAVSTTSAATAWTIATLPQGNSGNLVYAAGKIWNVGFTGYTYGSTDGAIWVKYTAPAGKEGSTVTSVMSNLGTAGNFATEYVYLIMDGTYRVVSGSSYDYSAIFRTATPEPSAIIESFPVVESPDA